MSLRSSTIMATGSEPHSRTLSFREVGQLARGHTAPPRSRDWASRLLPARGQDLSGLAFSCSVHSSTVGSLRTGSGPHPLLSQDVGNVQHTGSSKTS